MTEGDVVTVFSQFGEVVDIRLVRDKKTGKHKGFGFLCYEDQRSTILAVDNLNGAKVADKTLLVDHIEEYKIPLEFLEIKDNEKVEDKKLYTPSGPDGLGWGEWREEQINDFVSEIKLEEDIKAEEPLVSF